MSEPAGSSPAAKRPLALTMGEPGGIGPDLTLRLWLDRIERRVPAFLCLCDPDLLHSRAAKLGLSVPIEAVGPAEATDAFADALPVSSLSFSVPDRPGRAEPSTARAVIEAIERAVQMVRTDEAAAIVTNPIQKAALYGAGFAFPGHTEFLAALAARNGPQMRPVMMLATDDFRVVPVTIHIPLKDVSSTLTTDLIVETARIVARDLATRFGVPRPRLAIAGLNPHAGEDGALGREDREVVAPAVERLRGEGYDVTGPHPADTMFHAQARRRYDVALAMYHDQGLVPIKTIAFDEAVNITLGLPFIRTSPDHGTALDIAGTGKARADSLAAAMKMAARMAASGSQAP